MTRKVAHITLQAVSPLKVGSNASDLIQDSPIQRDFNALPMILGTSIAGVLRKDFKAEKVNDIFGDDNGSKVIFSNALLLDENDKVSEELLLEKSRFLKLFDNLPIREHTAITEKGVAKEHGKFDEEVVYRGTRFKFSIELIENDKESFEEILSLLSSTSFRLGGGSTKGFGKFKIIEIKTDEFDLESYENYSSSLNHLLSKTHKIESVNSSNYIKYSLKIKPDDFFMFGSGFGDSDADMTPVYEQTIDYDKKDLTDKMILIPASSLKGAIAHRTTYHYNLKKERYIGNSDAKESIKEIFGEAKDSKKEIDGSKGKVIFSDCFLVDNNESKIFDHVSIDRFTGGAIDGALFQEKTIAQKDELEIEILLHKDVVGTEKEAFESALTDITTGMLALGGMTTKGHGVFIGSWSKSDGK
ncbi:MAG: RAMP superfamily CRISPR-associated protein [Sulfurimonas sp.]|nr:RAMP superfamily CRISPR-associated protein [Sulfurimonas sp.]